MADNANPTAFDEAVAWAIECLSRYELQAPDHFTHICEGVDATCGCSFQGE